MTAIRNVVITQYGDVDVLKVTAATFTPPPLGRPRPDSDLVSIVVPIKNTWNSDDIEAAHREWGGGSGVGSLSIKVAKEYGHDGQIMGIPKPEQQ